MGAHYERLLENSRKTRGKTPRKLKADWIKDICRLLKRNITGLDKCTIATLESLYDAIDEGLYED